MGIMQKIIGYVSGNGWEIDANGNGQVVTPLTASQAGFVANTGITGPGATVGGKRYNPHYVSESGGSRIAIPHMLWDDTFNANSQNTGKYRFAATTMLGAQANGQLTLNNSSITTVNTNCAIQSHRVFPLFAKNELRVNIACFITQTPQANQVIEFGLFTATIPGGAAPTDGVFFRYNAAAELRGVISYNGTETQTAAITPPSASVNHDFLIVLQTNTVVFIIDDTVVGTITLLTDAPALGQPMIQASVPFTARTYIGATPPALATQLKITDVFVTSLGPDLVRPWGHQKAGFGHMLSQGQNGGTMGTTAQYANNANPAAQVPTNTTAAPGTGLGGKFQETLTLAAGTDGIIQSYQNPVGGINQTPRNLIITGVTISGVVTAALTTNPLAGTMSLAYGHTAVSLATTESSSFVSPTTKAPRRVPLTTTSVASSTAAVGTPVVLGSPNYRFDGGPIVVAPGEFIAVTHNKVTTAPATGAIMWTISFDGYWE